MHSVTILPFFGNDYVQRVIAARHCACALPAGTVPAALLAGTHRARGAAGGTACCGRGPSGQTRLRPRTLENSIEHRRCHPARERVLLAGVIAADEEDTLPVVPATGHGKPHLRAVTEGGTRPRQREASRTQHRPRRF